ncbi:MAG: DUF3596 domain-containing protein [Pseudomonadota bacterium]|mgnify:CR=1 FL=1
MGNIRAQPSGKLYFDFRYLGKRCREITALPDTAMNRKLLTQTLKKIEAEILTGQFDYAKYFPTSTFLKTIKLQEVRLNRGAYRDNIPSLNQHTDRWLEEREIEWRINYRTTIINLLEKHVRPELGELPLDAITRDVLVSFRTGRAKYRTPGGNQLSNCTINRLMMITKAIIEDGCIRHNLVSPFDRIKKLKEEKTHVDPFSLNDVTAMIADVRSDFRDYLITRVFTGMRSAEINGLRWKCVDFDRREILIRETFTQGRFEYTKNDPSQREINMSVPVFEALKRQFDVTGYRGRDGLVFSTRMGTPIDAKNFTNRIWKPMLEDLGIEYRRPYNTRHTCATLWLASGESPEWVARQLGHANTQMLFSVYSRYVPNLTRNDGSAFERLLASAGATGETV